VGGYTIEVEARQGSTGSWQSYLDVPYTLTNGSGEFLLWEHPLCFWLEREGYDVT